MEQSSSLSQDETSLLTYLTFTSNLLKKGILDISSNINNNILIHLI